MSWSSNKPIYKLVDANCLQNCTVWEGGSLGSGDLNGTAVFAYVSSSTTGPADPSDVDSTFQEHDFFGFFGFSLSDAHSDSYSDYIGSGSGTTAPSAPSSTSSAPAAGQTVGAVSASCRYITQWGY